LPGGFSFEEVRLNVKVPKIALEEHVALPGGPGEPPPQRANSGLAGGPGTTGNDISRLLAEMDAADIEMSVVSPTSGQVQNIPDRQKAIDIARRGNDYLAEQVAKYPQRLQAFACLPLQDPDAAARELLRSIQELGLKGALLKGFSQVDAEDSAVYCDAPQYWGLWATMESLDVPLYLHPRYPLKTRAKSIEGHPWFRGSGWYFGVETATHALRMMASGLFDKFPKFTVMLGHLGEMLPSVMWRIDHRLIAEAKSPQLFGADILGMPAKKKLDHYLRHNFYVTTSGNFCTPTLMNAIAWLGTDRILFAVDYPYESVNEAVLWFDNLGISDADLMKIGRGNAEKLLKLGKPAITAASV
jgi:2,3-dihydroxybenzoate decarboxylase